MDRDRRNRGVTIRTTDRNGEVVSVAQVVDDDEVMLITDRGKILRCKVSGISSMGRAAAGVRGMGLGTGDEVVGMEILEPGATILTVTENGYGKRTPLDDYRVQKRGGQGIITIRTTDRNGEVVGVAQVLDDDEVMLITDAGKVLRARVSGISTMGRATQGVRVMRLGTGEKLVSMARLAERDVADGDNGAGSA